MIVIQMDFEVTDGYIFTIFIHTSRSISSVRSQIQSIWLPGLSSPWPRNDLNRHSLSVALIEVHMIVTNVRHPSFILLAECLSFQVSC